MSTRCPADVRSTAVTAAESTHLLALGRGPASSECPTVVERLERQVAATPEAPAVRHHASDVLSYAALNTEANRLAHVLIARGIGPEDRVALLLPMSAEFIVALWGVLKAGAIDFLTKPVDADALLEAVRRGMRMDDELRHRSHDREDARALFATLTPRERELVPYLVTGRLNKQIAGDLGIAEKTIKVHRSRIMHKLHIRSLVDLVRFMERLDGVGLVPATTAPRPVARGSAGG